MKKSIFISLGFWAVSVCNAHAEVLCNEWGDASYFGGASVIAQCRSFEYLGGANCATLDYENTIVTKYTDGSCSYIESCATCESGYRLNSEPIEYKLGEPCYIGDGNNVNSYTQDMLDKWFMEYYTCEKIPVSCATGYYGTTTNGTTGCSQCPTVTGIYTDSARTTLARATSISGENSSITDCHIPSGTYYDVTGTFKTNSGCHYKN